MSEEISNKTLAMLLVAAIVVSLGGTLISLNKLGELRTGGFDITGLAQVSGIANLSIEASTEITLLDSVIDFGAGRINSSVSTNQVILDSNKTHALPNGTWNWGTEDTFVIRNTGTTDLNITTYGEAPSSWIGGSTATPNAWFAVTGGEGGVTNACPGSNATTSWTVLSNTVNETVSTFLYSSSFGSKNELNMSVKLLIPSDATNGTKENTVVLIATEYNS